MSSGWRVAVATPPQHGDIDDESHRAGTIEGDGGSEKKELTLGQAAELMAVGYRQGRRIWKRYQADGDAGLAHRRRGRPSARRKPPALRAQVLARYAEERYADFGPTLMAEHLAKEKLVVNHETRQFARATASPVAAHRGVPRHLDEILSWEEERVVQGDWTVVCAGQRYQLDRQHEALSLVRRKVIVRTRRNGRVQLVYRGQPLQWRTLPEGTLRKRPLTKKTQPSPAKRKTAPAASHPWRRMGAGAGRKFWHGIKAEGELTRAASRLGARNSGRPALPTGNSGNNKPPRGHFLVS